MLAWRCSYEFLTHFLFIIRFCFLSLTWIFWQSFSFTDHLFHDFSTHIYLFSSSETKRNHKHTHTHCLDTNSENCVHIMVAVSFLLGKLLFNANANSNVQYLQWLFRISAVPDNHSLLPVFFLSSYYAFIHNSLFTVAIIVSCCCFCCYMFLVLQNVANYTKSSHFICIT